MFRLRKSRLIAITLWVCAWVICLLATGAGAIEPMFPGLVLVDEVNCGNASDPHTLTQSASGASSIQTILGRQCRVLTPTSSDKYFSYRLGQNMGLVAGKAYILLIEYPEDQPRSMWVINSGAEQTNGFHTGTTVGDALDPPYVSPNPESLNYPLSGEYRAFQMFFHLHHRYPNIQETRDPGYKALTPTNGIPVTIAQFKSSNDPKSAGAAVARIALYEAPEFTTYSLPINFPPAELPRRHLFWREEMSDQVIGTSNSTWRATPTDVEWYEYKARLYKFLGMNTYSKDLLEFGHNQGWDSTPYGGSDWYNESSWPNRWPQIVSMLEGYDLDVMPFYEYAGSIGQTSLALGTQRRCRPLGNTDGNGNYTHITWSERAYVAVSDPDFVTDVQHLLEITIAYHKNQKDFVGAWFRTRNSHMPADFSDAALARFATEANGGVSVTRSQISSSGMLYADYMEWWNGRRKQYLEAIRDYLRSQVGDDAVVLFTWDSTEGGISYPDWSADNDIISEESSYWSSRGWDAVSLASAISNHRQRTAMITPPLTWDYWEWQHSLPAPDPSNYTNADGVMLTHTFNRAYTVGDPASMDLFRTQTGLAMIRHYLLNEDALANVGYFVGDMNLAGPYTMRAEAEAVANGDPTYIGYLASSSYNRGFPEYVRNFNQAFLALPALPSTILAGAASDPDVVVRSIETGGFGTYLAVVNKSMNSASAVQITLPYQATVTDAATGLPLSAPGGVLTIPLMYPFELRSIRLFSGNYGPVVSAGPDLNTANGTVQLDGSATDDGNPNPPGALTIAWAKVSGPGTVQFASPGAAVTSVTLSDPGTYVLRLSADDGEYVQTDDVTVIYDSVPHLEYTHVDLGDGLYGWTFRIVNGDGLMLSYAVTMAFYTDPGTNLINVQFNSMDVNDEPTAEFAAQFGFDMERDTYSLRPFVAANSIPGNSLLWGDSFSGYREGDDWWEMALGTGYDSQHGNNTPVAYVVTSGNVRWTGTIARDSQLYDDGGVTDLPVGTILGDYTGNGVVDQADYTLWADNFGDMCSSVFAPGSYAEPDHPINTPEYTTWADNFGNTASQTLGMTQSVVPVGAAEPVLAAGGAAAGDFNSDGKVDIADYTTWADSFGQAGANLPADANADGVVDQADLTVWQDALGGAPLSASQSVAPAAEEEPTEELTPAQARRAKMQARRAAIRTARKARIEARRNARMERMRSK